MSYRKVRALAFCLGLSAGLFVVNLVMWCAR